MNPCINKKRLPFFDVLKSWAIFLVIWQHMISALGYGPEMWNTPVGKAICMFNMPLFMYVVGYFANSGMGKTFSANLRAKWDTLVLPMLIYIVLMLGLNSLYGNLSIPSEPLKFCMFVFNTLFATYWFIPMVVLCFFFAFAFRKIKYGIILSLFVALLIPRIYGFGLTTTFQAMYLFFVLGLYSHRLKCVEYIKSNKYLFLILSTAIFITCYLAISHNNFFYSFSLMHLRQWCINYALMAISGTAGITISIILIDSITQSPISPLIKYLEVLGQYTFAI